MLDIKKQGVFWVCVNRSGQVVYRSLQKSNCKDFKKRYNGVEINF